MHDKSCKERANASSSAVFAAAAEALERSSDGSSGTCRELNGSDAVSVQSKRKQLGCSLSCKHASFVAEQNDHMAANAICKRAICCCADLWE